MYNIIKKVKVTFICICFLEVNQPSPAANSCSKRKRFVPRPSSQWGLMRRDSMRITADTHHTACKSQLYCVKISIFIKKKGQPSHCHFSVNASDSMCFYFPFFLLASFHMLNFKFLEKILQL